MDTLFGESGVGLVVYYHVIGHEAGLTHQPTSGTRKSMDVIGHPDPTANGSQTISNSTNQRPRSCNIVAIEACPSKVMSKHLCQEEPARRERHPTHSEFQELLFGRLDSTQGSFLPSLSSLATILWPHFQSESQVGLGHDQAS